MFTKRCDFTPLFPPLLRAGCCILFTPKALHSIARGSLACRGTPGNEIKKFTQTLKGFHNTLRIPLLCQGGDRFTMRPASKSGVVASPDYLSINSIIHRWVTEIKKPRKSRQGRLKFFHKTPNNPPPTSF
jgi:hypothetical protein